VGLSDCLLTTANLSWYTKRTPLTFLPFHNLGEIPMRIFNSFLTTTSSLAFGFGTFGTIMAMAENNLPATQAFGIAAVLGFIVLAGCIFSNFRHNARMRKAASENSAEE
jgi:hypothetical protein